MNLIFALTLTFITFSSHANPYKNLKGCNADDQTILNQADELFRNGQRELAVSNMRLLITNSCFLETDIQVLWAERLVQLTNIDLSKISISSTPLQALWPHSIGERHFRYSLNAQSAILRLNLNPEERSERENKIVAQAALITLISAPKWLLDQNGDGNMDDFKKDVCLKTRIIEPYTTDIYRAVMALHMIYMSRARDHVSDYLQWLVPLENACSSIDKEFNTFASCGNHGLPSKWFEDIFRALIAESQYFGLGICPKNAGACLRQCITKK